MLLLSQASRLSASVGMASHFISKQLDYSASRSTLSFAASVGLPTHTYHAARWYYFSLRHCACWPLWGWPPTQPITWVVVTRFLAELLVSASARLVAERMAAPRHFISASPYSKSPKGRASVGKPCTGFLNELSKLALRVSMARLLAEFLVGSAVCFVSEFIVGSASRFLSGPSHELRGASFG